MPGPVRRVTAACAVAAAGLVLGCGDDAQPASDTASDAVADTVQDTTPDTGESGDAASDTTADVESEVDVVAPSPRVRFWIDERPQADVDDDEVQATVARYGDPIRVVVDGLGAGQQTLLVFRSGAGTSQAAFLADATGVVDLARDTPLDGDWHTADRDGFLYSMIDPPAGDLDLTIHVDVYVGADIVTTGTLARHFVNQDIVEAAVVDGTTIGLMAAPPGDGPFGGILCFGGSEGGTGTGTFCARYMASLGYAALGIGYFGADGLPDALEDVPLEILEGALVKLVADPRVAAGGVVVIGGSRGGELALILGARFPQVAAVVAQVPSGYVWGAAAGNDAAAWTYGGEPLPYVPSSGATAPIIESSEGRRGAAFTPVFLDDIESARAGELDAATTHIEAIDGPVLLLGAADDQLWPSCALADVAYQRLVTAGHVALHGDVTSCAPDAGHASVGAPGWSTVGSTSTYIGTAAVVLGGTVAGNGAAKRSNDTRTRALLERVLGPGKIVAPSSPGTGR